MLRDRVGLGGGSDVSKCLYLIGHMSHGIVTALLDVTPPYRPLLSHGILIDVSEY